MTKTTHQKFKEKMLNKGRKDADILLYTSQMQEKDLKEVVVFLIEEIEEMRGDIELLKSN